MKDTIKDILGAVKILVLLVFAYAAFSYVSTYERNTEPANFRSFSVSAEGKAVAVPDIAEFSFSVLTEGDKDINSLQNENTEKINSVIEYLKKQNIDSKDIKTQSYNLYPKYTYFPCRDEGPCPPPEIQGYSINQSVLVRIRNLNQSGNIISGVVENGANNVSQLNFTIDDRTELETKARAEAIEKAQEKAKSIAKAGGFKLGRLLSIDDNHQGIVQPYNIGYGVNMDSFSNEAVKSIPSIEAGSQDVIVNILLQYEIQ